MQIGSMKEVLLTTAKDVFLFNCRVAGLAPQTVSAYRDVLCSFIHFTGDMLVKELTAGHVRAYIATLDDGFGNREEHIPLMNYYAVIHTWIRWLHAQEFITKRSSGYVKPPRLTNLFSSRWTRSLMIHCLSRPSFDYHQIMITPDFQGTYLPQKQNNYIIANCN